MQTVSDTKTESKLHEAIISTLAFFSLYELPLTSKRIYELLIEYKSTLEEIDIALEALVLDGKVLRSGNLYSVKSWNPATYHERQVEISKKWARIDKFFNWLAVLPFVRQISVINSLALGTADSDSDIDFFVVTKNNRLYFVRSMIIVVFRLLGVYKTRHQIKDRFCFGFFVSEKDLDLEHLLIKPRDPYFKFWLANMRPLVGGQQYWQMMQANSWLAQDFPNFQAVKRLTSVKQSSFLIRVIKFFLEVILWFPSLALEPILRRIHIGHTFKLAENNTTSSTTVANAQMLKLHGADVRVEVAQAYNQVLKSML